MLATPLAHLRIRLRAGLGRRWVQSAVLIACQPLPVCPEQETFAKQHATARSNAAPPAAMDSIFLISFRANG